MTNTNDTYEVHMQKVDALLLRKAGIDHQSGEDTATWDRWNDGLTPAEHAEAIMEDWGFDG